jgi:hypothetical protein
VYAAPNDDKPESWAKEDRPDATENHAVLRSGAIHYILDASG